MPETGFPIENPMKPASILLLERSGAQADILSLMRMFLRQP